MLLRLSNLQQLGSALWDGALAISPGLKNIYIYTHSPMSLQGLLLVLPVCAESQTQGGVSAAVLHHCSGRGPWG